ncbi:hypothetical protein ACTFIU_006024 [Dictyostelium citrinum]
MNSSKSISSSSTVHYHPKNKIKFIPFGSSTTANSSFDDEESINNNNNNNTTNNNNNSNNINNNNIIANSKSPMSNKTTTIIDSREQNSHVKSNKLNFSDDEIISVTKNNSHSNNKNVEYEEENKNYNSNNSDDYDNRYDEEDHLVDFEEDDKFSSSSSSSNSLSTLDQQHHQQQYNQQQHHHHHHHHHHKNSNTLVNDSGGGGGGSKLSYTLTFIFGLIVIFACIFYFSKNLVSFLEFVKELGLLGNVILGIAFLPTGIPLAIFSIYIPLTLSAGFIYGFVPGFITVAIGSAISASFGFWTTRKLSLKFFESKIEQSPKLSSLRNRVEQHPFKIIIIMRLLPIPFGIQNGLCAVTRISYTKFIYSSVIGLTFENLLLSYLGSSIKSITDITNGHQNAFSSYQQGLIAIAIIAGIVLTCIGKKVLSLSAYHQPLPVTMNDININNNTNNSNNNNSNNNSNNNNNGIDENINNINTTNSKDNQAKDIVLVIKSTSSSNLIQPIPTPLNSDVISISKENNNNTLNSTTPTSITTKKLEKIK